LTGSQLVFEPTPGLEYIIEVQPVGSPPPEPNNFFYLEVVSSQAIYNEGWLWSYDSDNDQLGLRFYRNGYDYNSYPLNSGDVLTAEFTLIRWPSLET
jgi:hypothetical protein